MNGCFKAVQSRYLINSVGIVCLLRRHYHRVLKYKLVVLVHIVNLLYLLYYLSIIAYLLYSYYQDAFFRGFLRCLIDKIYFFCLCCCFSIFTYHVNCHTAIIINFFRLNRKLCSILCLLHHSAIYELSVFIKQDLEALAIPGRPSYIGIRLAKLGYG